MTDKEKLVEIILNATYKVCVEEANVIADSILAAGFGDVVQCTEDYERGVFKLAKRIVMLTEYCVHTDGCILSQWREGKPTEDGGYESLYGYGTKEKWYKRDEEPKCTCGLSDLMGEGKDGGE